jgi:DNA-binding CsgD family transcriptional regulator/tetratricopeptide (TPR) repeat protein
MWPDVPDSRRLADVSPALSEAEELGRPLLERDDEVAALVDAVAGAVDGHGGVVLIRAAAGLGKTRLLDVASALAQGAGMDVVRARGSGLERDFPFGVVLGLFESRVRAASQAERDEMLQGSAGLVAPMLLGAQPVEQALVGLQEHSLVHALQWVTVNLSATRPLAVIVDDMHWADGPSLRFLAYLAARVVELPVLIVGAHRPREPGAENELIAELASGADVRVLTPRPLSDAASSALVRASAAPSREAADEFIEACFGATGGNPLLLNELLRALTAEGVTGTAEDAARVWEAGPEPVVRSVRSTLARLSRDEAGFARAVSVLGDDADPGIAGRLAGLDAARAAAAGARLQDAGLLSGGDRFCFTHPMLRRAVYEDIATVARGDLHRRAAALMHERGATRIAAAHLLLAPAGGEAWAVDALRAAAAEDEARAAHTTAARLLRRALQEPPDAAIRDEVMAELALALANAGDAGAPEALEEAVAAARQPAVRARLLLALGRAHYQRGDMAAAAAACDRGLAHVNRGEKVALELEAAWVAAAMWTPAGGEAVARRLPDVLDGDAPARSLGERDLLAGLAGIELVKGQDRERALLLARRAWGDGAYLREGTCDAPAIGAMISALLRSGALDEALAALDALIADARARASPLAYATWRTARGNCLLHRGRLAEAESDLEEALEARRIGWEATVPLAVEALATVLLEQDRVAAAEAVIDDLGDAEARFGNGPMWGVVHEVRGRLRLAQGRPGEALPEFEATGRVARDMLGTSNPAVSPWRSEAALALRQLDRREEAAVLAAEEVADARRFGAPRALALALTSQALVVGGVEGAALAEEAATVAAAGGAALEAARARIAQGTLLRVAGKRSDAQQALRDGLDAAVACGGHALAGRAREELVTAGGRPRRTRTRGLDALTAGERRVALLAADGRSNREIADALFVTPRAVAFHLSSAYSKLGIHGRGELAATFDLGCPAQTLVGADSAPGEAPD